MLRFNGYSIVLQEVPDEISLAFNITGCPYGCDGCHSKYLWDASAGELLYDNMFEIIDKHLDEISCICFMGGDHDLDDLVHIINSIRNLYPALKIALYTGRDVPDPILWDLVDYLKIGHYDKELGGLNSPTTNQKMYKIKKHAENITHKFQPKGLKNDNQS